MCGEKTGGYIEAVSGAGSPPHVRGKGFLDFSHEVLEGITPAYAGKSQISVTFSRDK